MLDTTLESVTTVRLDGDQPRSQEVTAPGQGSSTLKLPVKPHFYISVNVRIKETICNILISETFEVFVPLDRARLARIFPHVSQQSLINGLSPKNLMMHVK